jgi:hypothetical protein
MQTFESGRRKQAGEQYSSQCWARAPFSTVFPGFPNRGDSLRSFNLEARDSEDLFCPKVGLPTSSDASSASFWWPHSNAFSIICR